jgi:hypothetical protein
MVISNHSSVVTISQGGLQLKSTGEFDNGDVFLRFDNANFASLVKSKQILLL